MAETKQETTKKRRGRPPKRKNENKMQTEEKQIVEQKQEVVDDTKKKQPIVRKKFDLNEPIEVKCIVKGGAIYISTMGFIVKWDDFGDINYLEYKELVNMLNRYRRFFEEPWIIMDWEVIKSLHAEKYYRNIIDVDNIDQIFNKSPKELKETLEKVTDGMKRLIADRATELVKEGKLDSLQRIKAIEDTLKIELT